MTLKEVLLGYGLGIVLAVLLGVAIAQVALLELSLMPYIVALDHPQRGAGADLPAVVRLRPAVEGGDGGHHRVLPILVNVIAGLQASGRDEIQMLRAFGASRTQILLKVRVPNALPYVFAGLELGVVFALP